MNPGLDEMEIIESKIDEVQINKRKFPNSVDSGRKKLKESRIEEKIWIEEEFDLLLE